MTQTQLTSVSSQQEYTPAWYVLNHIGTPFQEMARKAVDLFNSLEQKNVELFAPTYVVREERDGKVHTRTANLIFHYVFVRGILPDVKALCARDNGFSFLIDRSSESRYATISDREMESLQNLARAYENTLPYYSLDDIDLESGDLVEVVNGDFPGLIGNYIPHPKSKSGDIVLHVYNNVGAIAFNVKATDVRVLEFAHNTTRANDQIDAIVPHLFKAMRAFHAGEPLPVPLVARLSVFCRRMEVVKIDNRKLAAKLQAILISANHMLGHMAAARAARERYDHISDSVTNQWTRALIALLLSVTKAGIPGRHASSASDRVKLPPLPKLKEGAKPSKAQQQLIDEYTYYTATTPS